MATQQTPDQQRKEEIRANAMKNLKAQNLVNLAVAYMAHGEDSGYGKVDNDSVEQFLYTPSLKGANAYSLESGQETSLLHSHLVGSRKEGHRYSGNVSELGLMNDAATIVQQSLGALTVGDVMELMGSQNVPAKYKDAYIGEMLSSNDAELKEAAQAVAGSYMSYITAKGVSQALGKRSEAIRGGLERALSQP